jgi:hypothetical protein
MFIEVASDASDASVGCGRGELTALALIEAGKKIKNF